MFRYIAPQYSIKDPEHAKLRQPPKFIKKKPKNRLTWEQVIQVGVMPEKR